MARSRSSTRAVHLAALRRVVAAELWIDLRDDERIERESGIGRRAGGRATHEQVR